MRRIKHAAIAALIGLSISAGFAHAQTNPEVLTGDELKRVVPASFYFAGQSADTQMRNSAAAKFGKDRFLIVGLVDTSGYSTEISGVYEGFLITDSPVRIGGKRLGTGAYGFGFGKDSLNIFDLSAKKLMSVPIKLDSGMKRPRPVMLVADGRTVRLYKGKNFAVVTAERLR